MMNVVPSLRWISSNSPWVRFAQLAVERGERLVEQKHARAQRQRPGQRHPLALAARQLVRTPPFEAFELRQRQHLGDARGDVGAAHAGALQAEGDVARDAQMRKQRIVLEHHVDRPLVRRDGSDVGAIEQDAAGVRLFETGKHAQQRALAAAGRAEQRKEFAGTDVERQVLDGDHAAEPLGDGRNAQQRRSRRPICLQPARSPRASPAPSSCFRAAA